MTQATGRTVIPLPNYPFVRRTVLSSIGLEALVLVALGVWSWVLWSTDHTLPEWVLLLDVVGGGMILVVLFYAMKIGRKPAPYILVLQPESLQVVRKPVLLAEQVITTVLWDRVRIAPLTLRGRPASRIEFIARPDEGELRGLVVSSSVTREIEAFRQRNPVSPSQTAG
jgi:hypothetical protein